MIDSKTTLRKKLIAERLEISSEIIKKAASLLAGHLLEAIPPSANVAGYSPIRGEIDVREALAQLAARGNKIALPVVDYNSRMLKFLEYSPGSALTAGKFGTSCPLEHLPEIFPDVIIVPLVGFDTDGNRLGYGGGYYDTTIRALRNANSKIVVIGVAYNLQKLDAIEFEEHDEKMDMVITETGIVK